MTLCGRWAVLWNHVMPASIATGVYQCPRNISRAGHLDIFPDPWFPFPADGIMHEDFFLDLGCGILLTFPIGFRGALPFLTPALSNNFGLSWFS